MTERHHEAIARFARACAADPLVVAAFLGGSLAAGTADDVSDLDLYVVTEEADYDAFFARRADFARSWGNLAVRDTTRNSRASASTCSTSSSPMASAARSLSVTWAP